MRRVIVAGADERFPASHAAWDEAAAAMPTAWREGRLGALVEALPVLDGGESQLPSRSLPRAASLLALLAHGYFYFGGNAKHTIVGWYQ